MAEAEAISDQSSVMAKAERRLPPQCRPACRPPTTKAGDDSVSGFRDVQRARSNDQSFGLDLIHAGNMDRQGHGDAEGTATFARAGCG